MEIEYDPEKAVINESKYGVTFEEAASALPDENALAMEDSDSEGEERWIVLGMSNQVRLLTVVYTLREDSIRLISARKATRKEEKFYA